MLWPDEIRPASFDFLDEDVKVRPQELSMASSLIDSMAADFKPEEFTDDYRAALQKVIDAKVSGEEIVAPPEVEEAPSSAIDLMAALRASVERAKAAREASGPAEEHRLVAPTPITAAKSAKSAPARKAAPKAAGRTDDDSEDEARAGKATAKRTPAKKTATKASDGEPAARKAPAKSTAKRASAKSRRSA
jgi:DNA end-binding protein Ku